MQNKNQSSTVKNHGNICFARELRSFRNTYMYGIKIMLIALLAMKCNNIGAQTITTFAGTGSIGASGMGGPATTATFYYPMGVVLFIRKASNYYC